MELLIIGPPGAGKGTMGELISNTYGIPVLSTGDILRKEIKEDTELGKLAASLINQGLFVPDDIISNIVKNAIQEFDKGYLLDGFPRSVEQAEIFEDMLNQIGKKIDGVISLSVPDDIIIERLSKRVVCSECGKTYHLVNNPPLKNGSCNNCNGELIRRPDDEPEHIKTRLSIFHETTKPIVDYYGQKNLLYTIESSGSIEDQFSKVRIILDHIKD